MPKALAFAVLLSLALPAIAITLITPTSVHLNSKKATITVRSAQILSSIATVAFGIYMYFQYD